MYAHLGRNMSIALIKFKLHGGGGGDMSIVQLSWQAVLEYSCYFSGAFDSMVS